MYDQLLRAVDQYFDEVKVLRRSARGVITLLRHRKTGKRYVFRQFMGSADVYRRLLTVECPYLPRIEEVADSDGRVAVLEEYVQGDTLLFLLEGGLLDWAEAKKVTQDVCAALWMLTLCNISTSVCPGTDNGELPYGGGSHLPNVLSIHLGAAAAGLLQIKTLGKAFGFLQCFFISFSTACRRPRRTACR